MVAAEANFLKSPLLLILALLSVALAGCMQQDDGARTPEERAEAAAEKFQAAAGPDGDLRALEGSMNSEGMKGEVAVTFGTDEAMKMEMTMGGFFNVVMYCTKEAKLVSFGGETYEGRPTEDCFPSEEESEDGSPLEPFEEAELLNATEKDGIVTATFRERNASGAETLITVTIDENDRITHLMMEGDDGEFEMTPEYGAREALRLPKPDSRLPASVEYETSFDEGVYTWTATSNEDKAPISEFEIRVLGDDEEVLATFPLSAGSGAQGGFDFSFTDNGDGILGEGDSFTLRKEGWEYEFEHDVKVYDTWASMSIDENPMPAPGVALLVGVLGLAALALRRRA